MDFSFFHNLSHYLSLHPHVGGLITFAIAFAESIVIIGAIIPGSVTMTLIGTLIGTGALPFTTTFIWAILGAILGDFISYWIGTHYNDRLRHIWPFRKHPHWLGRGEDFFHRHGGKSIVIGRFFGPARSAIPLIAGLLHMSLGRFTLAAIPSAILWSLTYILPGVVVGALSLQLPPTEATKFILITLAVVAFGWIIVALLHVFLKQLATWTNRGIMHIWQYLAQHKKLNAFTQFLSTVPKNAPHGGATPPHYQLLFLLAAMLFAALFVGIFVSTITQAGIAHFNEPLFALFRSLHTPIGNYVFIALTLLGEQYVILPASVLILGWLLWKRYYWAALHGMGLFFLAFGLGEICKTLYYFPRPEGLLHQSLTSSFPSGHVLLCITLFGFLFMVLAKNVSNYRRKTLFFIISFFTLGVALSRIYLGAHWLTDVLASIFLGLACIFLVAISYFRRIPPAIPAKPLTQIAACIILVLWVNYGALEFRSAQNDYTLYWPKLTLTTNAWWQQRQEAIPLFVLSRLGKPRQVLNIQWVDELDHIAITLQKHGWENKTSLLKLKNTLQRLSLPTDPRYLPLLPTLYQNQAPIALFTRQDDQGHQIDFMLWRSNITLADSKHPLWLGSMYYFIPQQPKPEVSKAQENYMAVLHVLLPAVQGFKSTQVTVPNADWPPIMNALHWDGTVLLIQRES